MSDLPSHDERAISRIESLSSQVTAVSAMDAGVLRNVRGELIAKGFSGRIVPTKLDNGQDAWIVPSQTRPGVTYIVYHENSKWYCFCPDHTDRKVDCKHAVAVVNTYFPHSAPVVTDVMRAAERKHSKSLPYKDARRFPHIPIQYESGLAESTRKDHALMRQSGRVQSLLEDLSKTLSRAHGKPARRGGQPMPPGDLVLSMVMRAHHKQSLRRFTPTMRDLCNAGSIRRTRCKTSLVKYQNSFETMLLLMEAYRIVISAFRNLETTFLIDGTGFSPMYVSNFCEMKHGDGDVRVGTQWLSLHAMVGQKSKAILGFTLTPSYGDLNGELSQFDGFMEWLEQNGFKNRKYIVADNLYLKTKCIKSAQDRGMTLVCPTKGKDFDKKSGELRAYARRVGEFMEGNPKAYDWLCRSRSAIEGVFSVIKRSDNHIAAVGTADERGNDKLAGLYTSRVNEMLVRMIDQVLSRINEIELLSDERVSFFDDVPFTAKFQSDIPWSDYGRS